MQDLIDSGWIGKNGPNAMHVTPISEETFDLLRPYYKDSTILGD